MAKEQFEVSDVIKTSRERIYEAWLSSDGHAAMTGGRKAVVDGKVGGSFNVHEGQIFGKTLEVAPPSRILQSWRSPAFEDGHEDSQIEVLLEDTDGGTRVVIKHTNIPEGQSDHYKTGWAEYYFKPMKEYFEAS